MVAATLESETRTATVRAQKANSPFSMTNLPHPRPRKRLFAALGLSDDLFLEAFSDHADKTEVHNVFVDPDPSLLDRLQKPTNTFVFAGYGMGKTATKLALEYMVRNSVEEQPTLCVTYRPAIGILQLGSDHEQLQQHLEQIIKEASIDLFIQTLERCDDLRDGISDHQLAVLQRQVRWLPPRVKSIIRAAHHELPVDGAIWRGVRSIVRPMPITTCWRRLITSVMPYIDQRPVKQSWGDLLADVWVLGFRQVFLLIDAIDEGQSESGKSHPGEIVKPLLPLIDYLLDADPRVFLKCFLPRNTQSVLAQRYPSHLTDGSEIATIEPGTIPHLRAIIHERLQAASASHASIRSLDALKREDIPESIETRLAELAQGSPRRLLEYASALFDFHCQQIANDTIPGERLWITAAEWQEFLRRLEQRQLSLP